MTTIQGFCQDADVRFALNSNEISLLLKDTPGSAEVTGLMTRAILWASYRFHAIAILGRPDYKDVATLSPVDYTADTHPLVRDAVADLAADWLRRRVRKNTDELTPREHPTIVLAEMIRDGLAHIPGVS